MTGSGTYAQLEKKYQQFRAPSARVKADGVDLTRVKGLKIANLAVELTSGYEASGCTFEAVGEYEPDRTGFDPKGAFAALQIGAKIEVALGYIKLETVFSGLILELEYCFDEENTPYLRVECADAKCLLMKTRRMRVLTRKSLSDAVGELLSARPVSEYLSGREVAPSTGGAKDALYEMMESDYEFIVKNARREGLEFFILQGKAYLRRPPASAMPLGAFSPGKGVLSARLALRGGGLVEKVTASGRNPENGEAVRGSFTLRGRFSKGNSAARMLAGTEQTLFDPQIASPADAGSCAKTVGKALQNGFGVLSCTCLGLPELAPGRFVKIAGLMPEADRAFYITGVRHVLGAGGYQTTFEARVDGL